MGSRNSLLNKNEEIIEPVINSNDHRIISIEITSNNNNTHNTHTLNNNNNNNNLSNISSNLSSNIELNSDILPHDFNVIEPIHNSHNSQNNNSHNISQQNLFPPLILTPRREDSLYSKISYTPVGEQLQLYKYYCPLCMSFFQDIIISKCCKNYICSECIVDYLLKRNFQVIICI